MSGAPQMREQIAATYLQHLQDLACEISIATDAIAANALPKLQESVAKQEMLCASLATMASTVNEVLHSPERATASSIDTGIDSKIHAVTASIRELNSNYAALLRHSGRSIAMLTLLCKSHMGRFQEDRGARMKHQTWSCEM